MTNDELLRLIDEAAADRRPTLDLSGQGLSELPPEIGKLTNLRTLVLGRWDKKKGSLGNNLKALPNEISALTELRSLLLEYNEIEELPGVIGTLKKLRSFSLAGNKLSRLLNEMTQLESLRTLDISRNQLYALPEVIGKLTNLRSFCSSDNQIKKIPGFIGHLTKLRTLDLRNNQLNELPEEISQMADLRVLKLTGNQLTVFPKFFSDLTALQSLNLRGNRMRELTYDVSGLRSLRSLDLSFNQLSNQLEVIGQLTSLRLLDLRFNQISKLPKGFGQLTNLKTLYVHGNQLTNLSEEIGQLTSLDFLDLSSNQLCVVPESIGRLTDLKELNLSGNQIINLPEEIGRLTNLESIDFSDNQACNLPESVGYLSNLRSLNVSGNQLNSLPESIGNLSDLRSLYLWNNQLGNLPTNIGQLSNLQSLDLSGNQLIELPLSVGHLINLQSLNLSENKLDKLPGSIGLLLKLRSLNLSGNQLSNLPKEFEALEDLEKLDLRRNPLPIPPEILGAREIWQAPSAPTETLKFYFGLQEEEEGSTPLYEAKLILVGEGGAGKTSLAKKIDSEDYKLQDAEKSTEGIDVIRWDFPLPDNNAFRTNIWDFGGQEIYHATHQFFLTKRSLYLLVADTRQENTDFYYWLKIVELLSESSPVLVIKNEKQDRQCQIDEGLYKSQFSNLKDYFSTNLEDNRGLDKIKEAIRYHITQLPHVGNPLPKIWVRVRASLENYAQNCNTITVEHYFDICRQNGFTDKQQMLFLSSYLHDLGVCLHFQEDKFLKRTIILKPEWATAAVYKVADSDIVRNNKGHFTESDTAEIWSEDQYSELRDELLQLMMRFKLAYELPNQLGHYIAPQLLPVSQPEYEWDSTDNLILRYTYDFMPKGIITRFIVEINRLVEDSNTVWKSGVILSDLYARAEVIENYYKGKITIRVTGSNRKALLEKIRYELWKIHQSYERLQYDELIPCNCSECQGRTQPEFYPYDLLVKYINDNRYAIECRTSYEQVDVRRLIADITEDNRKMRVSIEEDRLQEAINKLPEIIGEVAPYITEKPKKPSLIEKIQRFIGQ